MIDMQALLRWRAIHPKQTASVLIKRVQNDTFAAGVPYAHSYFPPNMDATGVGNNGTPSLTSDVWLNQIGESAAPAPDDKLTDSAGNTWLIKTVATYLNFTPTSGLHKCSAVRLRKAS